MKENANHDKVIKNKEYIGRSVVEVPGYGGRKLELTYHIFEDEEKIKDIKVRSYGIQIDELDSLTGETTTARDPDVDEERSKTKALAEQFVVDEVMPESLEGIADDHNFEKEFGDES